MNLHKRHGAWALKRLVSMDSMERPLQEHLEKHPWLITGPHYPEDGLVISQLDLGGRYRTDFAYFWQQSGGDFLQLIEIERAAIPVFTKKDEFRGDFNHALQQISDWPDWFIRYSEKVAACLEPLFDNGWITGLPHYQRVKAMLIAGRRSEILANQRRRERWEKKVDDLGRLATDLRTWDGFIESIRHSSYRFRTGDSWKDLRCVRYSEACKRGPGHK